MTTKKEYKPTKKVAFVIKILRQYADETGSLVRSTSDLSPLEEWLLIQLFLKSTDSK